MPTRTHARATLLACLLLGAVRLALAAPPLTVSDAWVRVTPGAEVAAAYFTLHNAGAAPVSVVAVSSPLAGMANKIPDNQEISRELHLLDDGKFA